MLPGCNKKVRAQQTEALQKILALKYGANNWILAIGHKANFDLARFRCVTTTRIEELLYILRSELYQLRALVKKVSMRCARHKVNQGRTRNLL